MTICFEPGKPPGQPANVANDTRRQDAAGGRDSASRTMRVVMTTTSVG